VKRCDDERTKQREQIIGLGERSFRKSYYPQLKQNAKQLERFKTLLDQTSDFVMLVALPRFEVTDVNDATITLFNTTSNDIIGHPLKELHHISPVMISLLHHLEETMKQTSPENHAIELEMKKDKQIIWLELSCRITSLEEQYYAVMVGRDITERKHHNELLEHLLAEKEALLDNALVGLAWIRERTIVSCNRRLEDMLGYAPGKIVGQPTRILYENDEIFTDFGMDAYRALINNGSFTGTVKLAQANGDTIWCELTGNSIDMNKPDSGSVWIISDVNQHMLTKEKAVFLSHHDALTKLPNHRLLEDRFIQATTLAVQNNKVVALINLDLDHFKKVNDVFGYHNSNQLLIEVSKRLLLCIDEHGTLCRQGGDEFLILLPELDNTDSSFAILSQLFAEFEKEFMVNEHNILLTASLGITFYPQDGESFESLLSKADMAMYEAKEAGRNTFKFFNDAMNKVAYEQLTITFELRKALAENQFELYYQPQIDITTGRIIGAEALIRWHHPELGFMSPATFIPIAEETGLIVSIGEWVIQEACRTVNTWQEKGLEDPVVAVNLSAVQFSHGDIKETVRKAIDSSGIFPEMLELELTESIMIEDTENVLSAVKSLKMMGCKLSIDDFGTGYSSLAYLKRFAVDKLKIDQIFIRDLIKNQDDAVIVRAIIHMARSLGLKTIAEGIEKKEVLQLLKDYSCDEAQGYFIARPMPADDFLSFIDDAIEQSQPKNSH